MTSLAATVILYNPDEAVLHNIHSYYHHVNLILAIDNSDNPSKNFIESLTTMPKIMYIANGGNQGMAHALNVAANKAIELGYKWLLTMDQDSSFTHDGLEIYIQCAKKIHVSNPIAIMSPNRYATKIQKASCVFTEKLTTITSGSLLNLSAYLCIGQFDEALFIDEVDHDYCLRAYLNQYKVIEFNTVFLQHQIGNEEVIKRHGNTQRVNIHSPLRHYYIMRNCLYIFSKYHHQFPDFTRRRLWEVSKTLLFALIYSNQKMRRGLYISKAIRDFLVGKRGKYES